MKSRGILVAVLVLLCALLILSLIIVITRISPKHSVWRGASISHEQSLSFMEKEPAEGLMDALVYYQMPYAEIVYAQAKLETEDFTSKLCKINNNLFGLYNSNGNYFYTFAHWTESVEAYRDWVQVKLKEGEDYYLFLKRIGYAEDSTYIDMLKQIVSTIE